MLSFLILGEKCCDANFLIHFIEKNLGIFVIGLYTNESYPKNPQKSPEF